MRLASRGLSHENSATLAFFLLTKQLLNVRGEANGGGLNSVNNNEAAQGHVAASAGRYDFLSIA
jgi:hypothetical protein